MASRRRVARIIAMQTIFESECRSIDPLSAMEKNAQDIEEGSADIELAELLVCGVIDHKNEICQSLEKYAPEWPFDRMDTMTRSILLIAGYELLYCPDTPSAVIMNEAIDIAKEFGPEESQKFVNGVLNALAKAVRTPSLAA